MCFQTHFIDRESMAGWESLSCSWGNPAFPPLKRKGMFPFRNKKCCLRTGFPALWAGRREREGENGEAVAAQPLVRCGRCPGGGEEASSSPGYDLGTSASSGHPLQPPERIITARKERGEGPSSDDCPFVAGLVLGSHFPQY